MSRLIDADALIKQVEEEGKYLLARGQAGAEHILLHNIVPLIDNAPTIDYSRPSVDEVIGRMTDEELELSNTIEVTTPKGKKVIYEKKKSGHWIKISPANIYECSECHKDVCTADIECYEFCHRCGADMRGEEE